jgi:hypothetical protein
LKEKRKKLQTNKTLPLFVAKVNANDEKFAMASSDFMEKSQVIEVCDRFLYELQGEFIPSFK